MNDTLYTKNSEILSRQKTRFDKSGTITDSKLVLQDNNLQMMIASKIDSTRAQPKLKLMEPESEEEADDDTFVP